MSTTAVHRLRAGALFVVPRAPLIVIAALLAYLALSAPFFLDAANLAAVARQSVPLAILAAGLAVVVIGGGDDVVSGGIDLSVPAAAVLAVAIISQLVTGGTGIAAALALGLGAALVVGATNAVLVVAIGLAPLLATLATSVAAIGLARVVTANRRITVDHPFVATLRDGDLAGIPLSAFLAIAALLALGFLVHRTRWGAHLQAIGGNRAAAELAGLPIARSVASTYILAALAAAVASLAILARGSGSSPGTEETLLLEMVLATFLGGAFSRRRVVTVWGAFLGALLVTALSSGFALLQIDIFRVSAVKGGLILLVLVAAALDQRLRR